MQSLFEPGCEHLKQRAHHYPTPHSPLTSDLGLLVVLHGHGDDVEPDDDGDEQVQVVAGAHLVDEQACGGVIGVVWLTLSFCWKWEMVGGFGVGCRERGSEEEEEEDGEVAFKK